MAVTKKQAPAKKGSVPIWHMSWKNFFIAASVAANIAFIVVLITTITSHAFDGMFINEGLTRYCASDNNDKFTSSSTNVRALREYTCASGNAKMYFNDGFKKYLDSRSN